MLYSPRLQYALGFLLLAMIFPVQARPHGENSTNSCNIGNRYLFGHLETVTRIEQQYDTRLVALIDSGSTTSSMDSSDITIKTMANGSYWVRFSIKTERGHRGKSVTLFKPVKRFIRVVTHSGPPERRPVIEATVELGGIKTNTEFSLTSRSKFPQSILLGRNTLNNLAIIDTSQQYLLSRCAMSSK